jgi:hypothetical protein
MKRAMTTRINYSWCDELNAMNDGVATYCAD